MKTQSVNVAGKVSVWAVPTTEWERSNDPTLGVFRYEISTGTVWQDGAVRVCDGDVSVPVPEGVDLLARAIETLEEKIDERRRVYMEDKKRLEDQISRLRLLEHNP